MEAQGAWKLLHALHHINTATIVLGTFKGGNKWNGRLAQQKQHTLTLCGVTAYAVLPSHLDIAVVVGLEEGIVHSFLYIPHGALIDTIYSLTSTLY